MGQWRPARKPRTVIGLLVNYIGRNYGEERVQPVPEAERSSRPRPRGIRSKDAGKLALRDAASLVEAQPRTLRSFWPLLPLVVGAYLGIHHWAVRPGVSEARP